MPFAARLHLDGPPDMHPHFCGSLRWCRRNHAAGARQTPSSRSRCNGRSKLRIALDFCLKCFKMAFTHKKPDVHDRLDLLHPSFPLSCSESHGLAPVEAFEEPADAVARPAQCDVPDSVIACEEAPCYVISQGRDLRRFHNAALSFVDEDDDDQRKPNACQQKTEAPRDGGQEEYCESIHINNDGKEKMIADEASASSDIAQIEEEEESYLILDRQSQEPIDTEEECNDTFISTRISDQDDHGNEEPEGGASELSFTQTYKEDDIWSDEALISCQAKGFPPPISILANESHPGLPSNVQRTLWRSVKRGGRFVLQEVQACPEEFFQATREHGRLRLQLVRSDSENVDVDNFEDPPRPESSSSISIEPASAIRLDIEIAEAKHLAESTMEEEIRASDQMPAKHIDAGSTLEPASSKVGNSKEEGGTSMCGGSPERSVAAEGTRKEPSVDPRMEAGGILGLIENNISQMCGRTSLSTRNSALQLSKSGNQLGQYHVVETREAVGMSVVAFSPEQAQKPEVSGNNKMVTPIGGGGVENEQFKQDCQHIHLSSTYGFETSVNTLSPNQAFFQFPIQPVR